MENTLILGYVCCAGLQRAKGYRFRHESLPDRDRLIFVQRGSVTVRAGGETARADAHTCVYLAAGVDSVSEYTGEENDVILLWFERLRGAPQAQMREYVSTPTVMALAEACVQIWNGREPYRLMSLTYSILHHLWATDEGQANAIAGVGRAVEFIDRNFEKELPVADYAAMVYLSESHFRKLFCAATGKSPVAYRNERRLIAAEELIREGYTVSEAARTVGFHSLPFYCRLAAKRRKERGMGDLSSKKK